MTREAELLAVVHSARNELAVLDKEIAAAREKNFATINGFVVMRGQTAGCGKEILAKWEDFRQKRNRLKTKLDNALREWAAERAR